MFHNISLEDLKFVEDCKRQFTYDEETGKLYYKHLNFGFSSSSSLQRHNNRFAGKEVKGAITKKGYSHIYVDGKRKYAHRIIFAIKMNRLPVNTIDHINGDKLNNKWNNLRECVQGDNNSNVIKRKRNKSGLKGVSWCKQSSRWLMQIQYRGKKHFSFHSTKELAYAAYCLKSNELHGEFSNVQ